jgi:hypothetical protein
MLPTRLALPHGQPIALPSPKQYAVTGTSSGSRPSRTSGFWPSGSRKAAIAPAFQNAWNRLKYDVWLPHVKLSTPDCAPLTRPSSSNRPPPELPLCTNPRLQKVAQYCNTIAVPLPSIEIFFGPPFGCPIVNANVAFCVERVQPA